MGGCTQYVRIFAQQMQAVNPVLMTDSKSVTREGLINRIYAIFQTGMLDWVFKAKSQKVKSQVRFYL